MEHEVTARCLPVAAEVTGGGRLDAVMGLLSVANQRWFGPEERHRPFLASVAAHREALIALDGRYTVGLTSGAGLAAVPTNIPYSLARLGVAVDRLPDARITTQLLDLVELAV